MEACLLCKECMLWINRVPVGEETKLFFTSSGVKTGNKLVCVHAVA